MWNIVHHWVSFPTQIDQFWDTGHRSPLFSRLEPPCLRLPGVLSGPVDAGRAASPRTTSCVTPHPEQPSAQLSSFSQPTSWVPVPSPRSSVPTPWSGVPVFMLPGSGSQLPGLVSWLPGPMSRLPGLMSRLPGSVSRLPCPASPVWRHSPHESGDNRHPCLSHDLALGGDACLDSGRGWWRLWLAYRRLHRMRKQWRPSARFVPFGCLCDVVLCTLLSIIIHG